MQKITVGTNSFGYNQIRNFINLPFQEFKVCKKVDLLKIPSHIYFQLKNQSHSFLANLYYDLGLNKVALYHFFNAVNVGNTPWITTFEHYLPRGAHRPGVFANEQIYIGFVIKRLLHSSCKKLIAMSQFAYDAQLNYLNAYGSYADEIKQKMLILHPQQAKLIDSVAQKNTSPNFVTFTITGADFFRKGGKEILKVFIRLFDQKQPVHLNIVSNLSFGDYASKTTLEDQKWAFSIINKYPQINHYNYLPNEEVLNLLRCSDIGLLPSYDETYGYSVLEAQAAGCPVITTNGAAFPEINNDDIGWLIKVPLVEDNRSIPRSKDAKMIFSKIVEDKLYEIVSEVINNRSLIREKGTKSLVRIEQDHRPITRANIIEGIYKSALM
ncbi:glycosyltransferase [Pontibacter vulgaris]|uniref:glycosyltransferase n=1 Tax=Pontibacter vulgaris TaxID=2905679 RepID=UPI001FA70798|nr:glycosyltransferase [Pontibacter vulgaris]